VRTLEVIKNNGRCLCFQEISNGTQKPVAQQIIQSPKSPKSQQLADDLRKEAEADSEVFQINTQQNTNEPVVEQYRSASTTSAMVRLSSRWIVWGFYGFFLLRFRVCVARGRVKWHKLSHHMRLPVLNS
jgi:hypothetical protein